MSKSISQLNEYCKLHNFSIKFDRNKNINGMKRFDYTKAQRLANSNGDLSTHINAGFYLSPLNRIVGGGV